MTVEAKGKVSREGDGRARRSRDARSPSRRSGGAVTIEGATQIEVKAGGASVKLERRRAPSRSPAPRSASGSERVDFLGSGLAFPLRIDHRGGRRARARATRTSREAIMLILGTTPGRAADAPRVRLPAARTSSSTASTPTPSAACATRCWPRSSAGSRASTCSTSTVDLSEFGAGPSSLLDIAYALRATNDVRNLVYPFYLVPAEEARMRIPDIQLDDRRFQELVNEARDAHGQGAARSGPTTTSPTPGSR